MEGRRGRPREAPAAAGAFPGELTRQVNRFSSEETAHLEGYFRENSTPTREQRKALAEAIEGQRRRRALRLGPGQAEPARRPPLGSEMPPLEEKNIKYWFDHQRRARARLMRRVRAEKLAAEGARLPARRNPGLSQSAPAAPGPGSLSAACAAPRELHAPGGAVPALPSRALSDGLQADLQNIFMKNPALARLILESGGQPFNPLLVQTFLPGLTLLGRGQTLGLTLYVIKGQVRVTYHSAPPHAGAEAVEAATATLGPGSIFKKASSGGGAGAGQTLSVMSESVVTAHIMFH